MENKTRNSSGKIKRFRCYGDEADAEERGYISIVQPVHLAERKNKILEESKSQIPALIESANLKVENDLKTAVQKMGWSEFENNFLTQILEALGFHSIEITQPTRDGGKDGICTYQRGLVQSHAIVSAKCWTTNKVGAAEIQRLRGIRGEYDTAIIVTSSGFSDAAISEAKPSQNQRSVVLIDINIIVKTCIENGIGVKIVSVPTLYQFYDIAAQYA